MILFKIELDLIGKKWYYICFFSHNYANIRVGSYDSLPLEKTLILDEVVILL